MYGFWVRKLLFGSRAVMGLHLDAIFSQRDARVVAAHAGRARRRSRLAITVGHKSPLAEAPAHDFVASRQSFGKVVLVP